MGLKSTNLGPYITACIERARIEGGDVCSSGRRCGARHLRSAFRTGEGSWHRRASRAQTDDGANPEKGAAIPAPGFGVVRVELVEGKGVGRGDARAVVVALDRVCGTRSVRVRFRGEVGQCPRRATDMLKWLQTGAEV